MAEASSMSAPFNAFGPARPEVPAKARIADLLALRELQSSLGLEQTTESALRTGINAIVEILTIDCGLVLLDADERHGLLRVGWCQGRVIPTSEADLLERALGREIDTLRQGRHTGSLLLTAPTGAATARFLPEAVRELGYGSILALGLGSGGRRTGVLILVAREADAFAGEPMILAEILAAEMADQVERVRLRAASEAAQAAAQAPATVADDDPRVARAELEARNARLEAQAAIAAAATPGLDSERQVEMALKKAIETSGHAAGAIYLVETSDAGDDVLRFARGFGDPRWLEVARLPRWRRGEGLPGRVWESGEGVALGEIAADPSGFGLDLLHRAGYRRIGCEPLVARGHVIGVLEMFGSESKPYDARERALLRAIADQVGTAIHNARMLADVMRHSLDLEWRIERLGLERGALEREKRSLLGLLATASSEHEMELRAAAILGRLVEMASADAAALLATGAGAPPSLRLVAQRGFPDEAAVGLYQRPVDDPVLALGLANGSPTVVDLADEACLLAGWPRQAGFRHVVVAPCRSGGVVRGVLLLANRYAGGFEPVRATVEAASCMAALVLECAQAPEPEAAAADQHPADENAPATEARVIAPPDESPARSNAPQGSAAFAASTSNEPPPAGLLAQAQKMESLGRLAPGVVHSLNNTMTAIMGHASHIKSLVPDYNPVHDKAAIIEEQSQRATDLVRSVLAFSHGATGSKEPIDLTPLISETLTLLTRTVDPSIVLESRCAPSLPPVDADAGEIRQVLLNLAVNARDAMPDGGRIVFEARSGHLDEQGVASIPGLAAGDYLSVVVSDNGCGMTPEIIDRVFEPFYTTKPSSQGSGLGLTVVREIVRRIGGHVALSSAPGVGTAVRLYLPVAAPQTATPDPRVTEMTALLPDIDAVAPGAADETGGGVSRDESSEARAAAGGAGAASGGEGAPASTMRLGHQSGPNGEIRILVVDDEAVLREMTGEMLKSRGYEVLLAADGIEALDIYRREWGTIALVVLDMIMPRLGGLETFRRLTGMDRRARVLLCSGHASSQQVHQAVLEGAIGLLPKPFGMTELVGWVERGLRN
jgi:signal transduction histidine kinase/CheY-like chemotaxis protein/GAF domain-containing protein